MPTRMCESALTENGQNAKNRRIKVLEEENRGFNEELKAAYGKLYERV